METSIQVAGIFDAPALQEISVATFVETFKADNTQENMDLYLAESMSLEKLTEELADTDNIFFKAMRHDQLAGYAKIRPGHVPDELAGRKALELERLYVLQAFQGKKVGARLMNECLTYAAEAGFEIIWLGVWEHNHKALAFYEQFGFQKFSSHIFRVGTDDQTDIMMMREV